MGSKSWKWLKIKVKRVVSKRSIGTVAVLTLGATAFNIYSIKERFHDTVPTDYSLLDMGKRQYIYIVDPKEKGAFLKRHLSRWWPDKIVTRPTAWKMFEELQTSINDINDSSLRKFANLSDLLESECNHFSLCMDLRTALALARYGADPRLFISHRLISKDNKDYYGKKFRHIFASLPNDKLHDILGTLIKAALKTYQPTETEKEDQSFDFYSGFELDFHFSGGSPKTISETEFLKICLQGVVSHSRIYSSLEDLLSFGILDLLVVISREYHNNVEIMSLVLKVLANISCDITSAQSIKDTGCLKILAENATSSNIKLALPAKRALHNLDRRTNAPILPPGMYQLHPEHGCNDRSFKYDVVFIHGLLGGAFRTWRRKDVDPSKDEHDSRVSERKSRIFDLRSKSPMLYNPKQLQNPDENVKYPARTYGKDGTLNVSEKEIPLEAEDIPSTPSQCWPRDWLPTDCPTARIIALDFESFVSRWMNVFPVETAERRFRERSNEMLKKLQDVGIGQRPVVWVTHSMGGLLLKNILCQAEESQDVERKKICSNTKGIVFCSVPHLGTELAVLNTARKWLFLPTEEIEELSNEDKQLTELHTCFMQLFDRYKFRLLSIAEILETRTGLGMKFKLVPFSSSDIGVGEFIPLRLDHLSTCKPWSRGSYLYIKIAEFIKEVVSPSLNELPPTTSEEQSVNIETQKLESESESNTPTGYLTRLLNNISSLVDNRVTTDDSPATTNTNNETED